MFTLLPKSTEQELNLTLRTAREEIIKLAETRRKLDAALGEAGLLLKALREITEGVSAVVQKVKETS